MRIAVALLLVVTSCKKDPCEQAGNHMFGAIAKHTAAWLSLTPEEMDTAKASLVEDCKMRPWDEGASSCVGRAIDAKDLESCAAMQNVGSWRQLVMQQVDPNGQKRYPEIDALIAELAATTKAFVVDPGECKGPVPVVAIDRAIVDSLATKQALPEKAQVVGEWFTVALSRYLMKQQVTAAEVLQLRKWIAELPKDRVWGIVEADARIEPEVVDGKTFIAGEYLGTIHVVQNASAPCHRAFQAHSSESVKTFFIKDNAVVGIDDQLQSDFKKNIDAALGERVAKLRKGEPDPSAQIAPFRAELVPAKAKWHCTENTQVRELSYCGPDLKACNRLRDGDEYTDCAPGESVVCASFHDVPTDSMKLSCHMTMATCAISRRVMLTDGGIDQLSRCRRI